MGAEQGERVVTIAALILDELREAGPLRVASRLHRADCPAAGKGRTIEDPFAAAWASSGPCRRCRPCSYADWVTLLERTFPPEAAA